MRVWAFVTSSEAYAACQCDDRVKNGDTLVIAEEGVVGLAWTWPVAVTKAHGPKDLPSYGLHTVGPYDGACGRILTDMGADASAVQQAIDVAEALGFPVNDRWRDVACEVTQ